MIDWNRELTPGLRAWYFRNKPILSEIGVWIPVAAYLALFVVIIFPVVKDNPPGLILRNAAKMHVPQYFPIYCMLMHLVGIGILGYGAFKRILGPSTRGTVTGNGLMTTILSSSGYVGFMGKTVEVSEERMVMIYTNSVFSIVWVALAIWKIRITLVEVATA